ncbi:MAG TPA: hypothetical protein VJ914_38430 [Pseudonocardiaceae bacterium]|nr:hypothetical protein [Pseudonocardiaceae bacterium]
MHQLDDRDHLGRHSPSALGVSSALVSGYSVGYSARCPGTPKRTSDALLIMAGETATPAVLARAERAETQPDALLGRALRAEARLDAPVARAGRAEVDAPVARAGRAEVDAPLTARDAKESGS